MLFKNSLKRIAGLRSVKKIGKLILKILFSISKSLGPIKKSFRLSIKGYNNFPLTKFPIQLPFTFSYVKR